MWIAINKDGRPKLFEMPPKRFHEGPMLSPELVGFNDAISVGNDEYSFWAVQEFYDSNRIDDRKHLGYDIMTENEEEGHKVWHSYIPKCIENMTWEDEPIEIEISLKDRVQPKQEWSEKDEEIVEALNYYVKNLDIFFSGIKIGDKNIQAKVFREKVQDWLKSLKDRVGCEADCATMWKPSEEMLEALYKAIPENVMAISENEMLLNKLYQGLKYGRVLSKN